jgi:2-polyprenyl-3-methyl-5-hydroxy-6-metoxy-1,4-benzoquinol methylase
MTKTAVAQYDEWHAKLDDEGGIGQWHTLARELLEAGRLVAGRAVLEIGCGRGGFAEWLASAGAQLTAADVSTVAVETGRARSRQAAITWRVEDIQELSFPDCSFDVVVSCETVEHLPDPMRAVRELARVLRPGGALVLTCPNYLGPLGLYRGYLRLRGRKFQEAGQPINQFTVVPRTARWLQMAGLRMERFTALGHYLPFPGRPPIRLHRLDSLWPLKPFALHSAFRARKTAGARSSRQGEPSSPSQGAARES